MRRFRRDFSAGGGDLIDPARAAGEDLDARKRPDAAPYFRLRFLQIFRQEDDLNLLDVVAVEEQLDGCEQRLAAVDLDERVLRLPRPLRPVDAVSSSTLNVAMCDLQAKLANIL